MGDDREQLANRVDVAPRPPGRRVPPRPRRAPAGDPADTDRLDLHGHELAAVVLTRTPVPRPAGGGGVAAAVFLAVEAVLLGVLHLWQPRFFLVDDEVMQYLPVWHWLGRNLTTSGLPLMDPDQGSAGAFTADLQYGVLDPFHWALAYAIGRLDGLSTAAWGLHVLAVVVLGLGVVALTRRLGASPGWAAAAALGAANAGFLMWIAASWWPAAWGTALLPWLWWSLVGRTRWAVPAAALAAYLLGTSGYPYALPFAALVVVGVLAERGVQRRDPRLWRDGALLRRVVSASGGLLASAPGLLAASAMAGTSARSAVPDNPLGNDGSYIPNLFDVLVGGPTTSPQATGWWGGGLLGPAVTATAWFVVPLLALVPWRTLRRRGPARVEGLPTAGLLLGAGVLATQLPTVIGTFRMPLRYLAVVQLAAPVLVVVVVAAVGLRITRRRLLAAAALCLAQGLLAVARIPALSGWHAAGVALGVLALGALAAAHRRAPRLVVAAVVAMTAAAPLVGVAAAIGFADVQADAAGTPRTGTPDHGVWDAQKWPASVSAITASALEPGLSATVVNWGGFGPGRGLAEGVPTGSAALYSGMRVGYGYSSLGQVGWTRRWCQDGFGDTAVLCDRAEDRLLAEVPGTGLTWLEVTSQDVLLLDDRAPVAISRALQARWVDVGPQGVFQRWERRTPTSGRITATGSSVTGLTVLGVGTRGESYRVSWDDTGDARLITRTPWWPGYSATVDGKPVAVHAVDDTVLAVDLPAGGGSGVLRISFTPPRLRTGLAAAGVGVLLGLVATGAELRRRRRACATPAGLATAPR